MKQIFKNVSLSKHLMDENGEIYYEIHARIYPDFPQNLLEDPMTSEQEYTEIGRQLSEVVDSIRRGVECI